MSEWDVFMMGVKAGALTGLVFWALVIVWKVGRWRKRRRNRRGGRR